MEEEKQPVSDVFVRKPANPLSVPAAIIAAGVIVAVAIVYSNKQQGPVSPSLGTPQAGQGAPAGTAAASAPKFLACLNAGQQTAKIDADLQDAVAAGGQGTPYSVVVSKSGKTFPISGALPFAQVKSIVDSALADQGGKADIKFRPISAADHIWGDPNAPVKIIEYSDLQCPFCQRFHPTMQQIVTEYKGQVAWVYRHFPLEQIHPHARKEAEAAECAAELGGNNAFWVFVDALFKGTPTSDPAELAKIATQIGLP